MGAISSQIYQPDDCLLNRLFRRRSKKASKLRVSGLCDGNSLMTGEFPAQMASNAETASIWWRHHDPSNRWVWIPSVLLFTAGHIPQRWGCESSAACICHGWSQRTDWQLSKCGHRRILFAYYIGVMAWRHFSHYWPCEGNPSPEGPYGVFSCWINSCATGDLRRHVANVASL